MVYVVCGAEILLGSPFLGRHQHRFSIFQHADSVVDAQHFQFANSSCGRCCRAKQMQDCVDIVLSKKNRVSPNPTV